MQEMAVPVFLELLGVRRSSGQACSESGGSSGERAPGVWIWLCPALELSLEQPRGFLLDDSAQEHLLCWAAAGLSKAAQGCPGCSSAAPLLWDGNSPSNSSLDGGAAARKNSECLVALN